METLQTLIEPWGYKIKNNILAFQKGPLSQWYGGFKDQNGGMQHLGVSYNCCEQYMMRQKALLFGDYETAEQIMKASSPKEQKELGRKVKNFDQEIWDDEKYEIVLDGNVRKYNNRDNVKFRQLIDAIPDFLILVEAAPWDPVWGNGLDIDDERTYDIFQWKGSNLLGKALMNVKNFKN